MENYKNPKKVEITIKYGPSFLYQIPDSFPKFNEDLFSKGYSLSKGELSYINSDKKKIIIKSKNDYIILLTFIKNYPYTVKLFFENMLCESVVNEIEFEDIENVYSDLNPGESIIDLGKMIKYDDGMNILYTINENEKVIDKGSLFAANKILSDLIKKKTYKKIKLFDRSKKPILLHYLIPTVESILNTNQLIFNQNDDNDDPLNIFTSHLEKIENNRNNTLILQTVINSNSKLSYISVIDADVSDISDDNNNNNINNEMAPPSALYEQIVECKNCHIKPIKNKRFKCPECINYDLCEKCEEKNAYNPFHPHDDFILIRIKENNFEENPYSYQCLTKNLVFNIKKQEIKNDEIIIKNILIKNNFISPWPGKHTLLKCDKSLSTIFCEKIYLPNLTLGKTVNIDFHFKKVNKIPKGNYKSIVDFIINGNKYGNPLEIFINVI